MGRWGTLRKSAAALALVACSGPPPPPPPANTGGLPNFEDAVKRRDAGRPPPPEEELPPARPSPSAQVDIPDAGSEPEAAPQFDPWVTSLVGDWVEYRVRQEGKTAQLRVEVIARDQNVAWVEFSLVGDHGQEVPVQWPRVSAFAVPFRLRPRVGDPSDAAPVDESLGGIKEVKIAKQKVKEVCDASPADAGYSQRTCRTPTMKPFYLTRGLVSDSRTTGSGRSARIASIELLDFGRGTLNAAGRLLASSRRFLSAAHIAYGRLTRVETSEVHPPGKKRRGSDAGVPDEHVGLAIIHVEAMRGRVVRWQEVGLLESPGADAEAAQPPVQVEGQRFFPDGKRRGEELLDVRGLGEMLVTGSYLAAWDSFTRKSPPIRGTIELSRGRSSLREVARTGDNQSKTLISVAADPLSDALADLPFPDRFAALVSKETSFSEDEPRQRTVTRWRLVDLPLMH